MASSTDTPARITPGAEELERGKKKLREGLVRSKLDTVLRDAEELSLNIDELIRSARSSPAGLKHGDKRRALPEGLIHAIASINAELSYEIKSEVVNYMYSNWDYDKEPCRQPWFQRAIDALIARLRDQSSGSFSTVEVEAIRVCRKDGLIPIAFIPLLLENEYAQKMITTAPYRLIQSKPESDAVSEFKFQCSVVKPVIAQNNSTASTKTPATKAPLTQTPVTQTPMAKIPTPQPGSAHARVLPNPFLQKARPKPTY